MSKNSVDPDDDDAFVMSPLGLFAPSPALGKLSKEERSTSVVCGVVSLVLVDIILGKGFLFVC